MQLEQVLLTALFHPVLHYIYIVGGIVDQVPCSSHTCCWTFGTKDQNDLWQACTQSAAVWSLGLGQYTIPVLEPCKYPNVWHHTRQVISKNEENLHPQVAASKGFTESF